MSSDGWPDHSAETEVEFTSGPGGYSLRINGEEFAPWLVEDGFAVTELAEGLHQVEIKFFAQSVTVRDILEDG